MQTPNFDYSNINSQPSNTSNNTNPAPTNPEVIESASASTACQTNNSKFAYTATGIVLGVITAFAIGIVLLASAFVSAAVAAYTTQGEAFELDELPEELSDMLEDDEFIDNYNDPFDDHSHFEDYDVDITDDYLNL